MPPTTAADVHSVLDLLAEAGASPVVAGGWGVDALLGRQTRPHADLDVAVAAEHEPAVLAALAEAGFEITTDWRPVRVALTHPGGAEVDVHPIRYLPDGSAVQSGFDDDEFHYPADGFLTGTIGERTIRCISASLQARFQTGYGPRDVDAADMTALQAATGVEWTP
jgi:lincosamide nucleotidyltransferase A/C/D/E